ncbi:MAG TPA: GSCFA domain-containing protein [Rhizomicrobium sp.]|nr:GSCFA domain-containing protein [Rhizomicrobium sp.]
MTRLQDIIVNRDGHQARFHGSWYRGPHTNFIPTKAEITPSAEAVDRYIMHGWTPAAPFVSKSTQITAFGSCFATYISRFLHNRGYSVFGKHLNLQSHIIRFGEGMVNTFALLQQFEWALENKHFPENLWFSQDKEVASLSPEVQAETRDIIQNTELFIMTLGLSEIWYDKRTGDALWRAVPASVFDENIHGFRVSSHQENYDNLVKLVALIRATKPSAKIVFTVSPVPLMATFRPVSCLTASSVSKSILRSAVDQLLRDHASDKNLFYFPAFEIVKEFFIDPYQPDNRHPKDEIVMFIMQTFERHFCTAP